MISRATGTATVNRMTLDRAACIGAPEHIFFPESGGTATIARRICAVCPVRLDCLNTALDAESGVSRRNRYGIYGGLTPDQRARLARKAAR